MLPHRGRRDLSPFRGASCRHCLGFSQGIHRRTRPGTNHPPTMNTTQTTPTATLPNWSIGDKTGTLFRDGNPTGTEFKIFNRQGGTPEQLVAQANAAPELLAACKAAENRLGKLAAAVGAKSNPIVEQLRAAIAKAEGVS